MWRNLHMPYLPHLLVLSASLALALGSALRAQGPEDSPSLSDLDAPPPSSEVNFGPMPLRALGGMGTIFYQPVAERATTLREGEIRLSTNLQYAAIKDGGFSPKGIVDLDGEILRWETRLDFGVLDTLELSITLPIHHTTGGFLDSTIDTFHELTGLPRSSTEGDNGFSHRIVVGDEEVFHLENHEFALADVPLELKWTVLSENDSYPVSLAVRTGVELPTGNEKRSLGSGGVDIGVGFILEKNFDTTSVFLSGNYVYLQRAGTFREAGVDFEDFVYTLSLAAEWRPWDWMGMTAQLDVVSNALADTGLSELDEPQIVGSLGMSFALIENVRFRLGFSEDMTGAASADFAAFGGLSWRLW